MTVRQLESLIRLSEARARLDLSPLILVRHVVDAFALLKSSIANLDQPDLELEQEDVALQEEDTDMRDSEVEKIRTDQVQPEARKVKLDYST